MALSRRAAVVALVTLTLLLSGCVLFMEPRNKFCIQRGEVLYRVRMHDRTTGNLLSCQLILADREYCFEREPTPQSELVCPPTGDS